MALLRFSTITNGKEHKQTLELTQNEVGIGRDPASTIVLTLDGVSRHHARLQATSLGWEVLDLGGPNGTWLDDRRNPGGSQHSRPFEVSH